MLLPHRDSAIERKRVDGLKTSDFDYDLPEEYIAQTPVEPRDSSRLLVLDRVSGEMRHRTFATSASTCAPVIC